MSEVKDKYSLWIVPDGETLDTAQSLVNELADQHHVSRFLPHLTLIGDLFATPSEQAGMIEKLDGLAQQIRAFKVRLENYGYKYEEARSLYLLAHGEGFDAAYTATAEAYPQVQNEHFMAMPHMSVLYGLYPDSEKEKIIAAHPFGPVEFDAANMQLFMTNGGAENWHHVETFVFAS